MPETDDRDRRAVPEPPPPGGQSAPPEEAASGAADDSLTRRLLRQWAAERRPTGAVVVLERTPGWDPDGGPYLELLGVSGRSRRSARSAWERAQLASDATPVGRALRPTVGLLPAGGLWWATRDVALVALVEPAGHRTPAAALRAARAHFELLAGDESDGDLVDLAIAAGVITDEPADTPAGAAPPADPEGESGE